MKTQTDIIIQTAERGTPFADLHPLDFFQWTRTVFVKTRKTSALSSASVLSSEPPRQFGLVVSSPEGDYAPGDMVDRVQAQITLSVPSPE